MIKFFKIITLISFIIYPNISFGNENYFNEGVKLFEKKRYEAALRRRQLSLVLAGKMKPKDASELKAIFD